VRCPLPLPSLCRGEKMNKTMLPANGFKVYYWRNNKICGIKAKIALWYYNKYRSSSIVSPKKQGINNYKVYYRYFKLWGYKKGQIYVKNPFNILMTTKLIYEPTSLQAYPSLPLLRCP